MSIDHLWWKFRALISFPANQLETWFVTSALFLASYVVTFINEHMLIAVRSDHNQQHARTGRVMFGCHR